MDIPSGRTEQLTQQNALTVIRVDNMQSKSAAVEKIFITKDGFMKTIIQGKNVKTIYSVKSNKDDGGFLRKAGVIKHTNTRWSAGPNIG
jgi:hypothetical protein